MMLLSPIFFALAQTPEEQMRDAFGQSPADLIFLLDTSLGVAPQTTAFKDRIADVVSTLPDGDRVTIVAFHTRSNEALPTEELTPQTRTTLIERIRKLEFPSANESDQGAAASTLLDILARPRAAQLRFVVWISDFCHAPSIQSPWSSGGRGCQPMKGQEQLETRASSLNHNLLDLHFLQVTREKTSTLPPISSLPELQRMLGSGEVVATAVSWFDSFLQNSTASRYRPLANELAQKADVTLQMSGTPTLEKPEFTLEFTMSPAGHGVLQSVQIPQATSELPSELDLSSSRTLQVRITPPPPPFSLWPGERTLDVPITVTASFLSAPAAAWTTVGMDVPAVSKSWPILVPVAYQISPLPLIGLGTALTLGASTGAYLLRNHRKLLLGGSFAWRKDGEERQVLQTDGMKELAVGILPSGVLGAVGAHAAILVIRRTAQDKAVVMVNRPGVEINARAAAPGEHVVFPGATSFRFEGYRLTWE